MNINSTTFNTSHLRRTSLDSQRSDKNGSASNTTANAPLSTQKSIQKAGDTPSNGEKLKQIGDNASADWRSNDLGGIKDLKDFTDILNRATDERAAALFAEVDTDNPTLVTNEGGFDVNASQGPEGSTYIDLGNDTEVFIFTLPTGGQVAYRVENGELGDRIPNEGSVDLGNGIYMTTSESPTGASEINFQQGPTSPFNLRPPTMTLSSDNTMLTIKNREGSNFLDFFKQDEVNSFDIQSGNQIVADGIADLDNMSVQQQFDYYADTAEGKRLLNVEGNVNAFDNEFYNTDAEKRLLVARVQYLRGEGGPELFNEFTPRRASLEGDDLAAYDAAVQDMMNEIREQGVYTQAGDDLDTALDESMVYMLASAAVEAYGNNPEAMEAIQSDIPKWIVSIDNADAGGIETPTGGVSASLGWFSAGNYVQFDLNTLIWDYSVPNDQFEMVTHELAHSLDNAEGGLDGIPPGLSDQEIQTLIAERERLFELAYPGQNVDSSVNQDHLTVAENSGFSDYTFHNRLEFWAELSTTFLSSDEGATIVGRASPELYDLLREYYGREDLPTAAEIPAIIIKPMTKLPVFNFSSLTPTTK